MLNELRFALRALSRTPGFSLAVIAVLALGIGANTAIFSFFRGVLLRPLVYQNAERVVILKPKPNDYGNLAGADSGLYTADFTELEQSLKSFEAIATYTGEVATILHGNSAELLYGTVVSPAFFDVFKAAPALGRPFTAANLGSASGRQVVISHSHWQTFLGGDPGIIGRTLTFNGVPATVVAVTSADFDYPRETFFWMSPAGTLPENQIGQAPQNANGRGNVIRSVIGRLKPGVSVVAAEAEIAARIRELPNPNERKRAQYLVTLQDQTLGDIRPALRILLSCVGLLLLIACFNVASLMLSRVTTRHREIGIRLALGSGGKRILHQFLIESLVLALAGGAVGVMLAGWTLQGLIAVAPADIPRLTAVQLDPIVMGFALLVSLVTGLLTGLSPIVATRRIDVAGALKSGGRAGSSGGTAQRLRSGLVTAEVAVSLVLLIAAGLLLRSFAKLNDAPWGFDPHNVTSARVVFMTEDYPDSPTRTAFYRELLRRLESTPGVDAVGTNLDRIGESWIHLPYLPAGESYGTTADQPQANYRLVSHDYLNTLGIPLQAGRSFTERDNESSNRVVIIDQALADRHYGGNTAVGQRLQYNLFDGTTVWAEIIGVAQTVRADGPTRVSLPEIYIPFPQLPWNNFFVHLRSPLGTAAAEQLLRDALREIDPAIPVSMVMSMEDVIAEPANARRFSLGVLGGFAGLALVLTTIGIYAISAFSVAQRRRELGIRLALGAQAKSVISLVLRDGLRPVVIGLGIGLVGGIATAFGMRHLLFGINPLDGPAFFALPVLLLGIGVLACWLPASRATRVDPLDALRAE